MLWHLVALILLWHHVQISLNQTRTSVLEQPHRLLIDNHGHSIAEVVE